jgi:branched-chain amino acid transport system ATP-binding protein
MGTLLEVRGLSLSFGGIRALGGVDLSLAEGETLAVIGPNGSGKTSLFNCITGVYRPDAGTVRFAGESLVGRSPDGVTRRGVARTFQNLRLFHNMSVLDNLLLGRHLHFRRRFLAAVLRRRGEEIRHRRKCEELIDFLNLQPYRRGRVADCPYGVQKRVELARALATQPRLLLLDEPVAGLTAEEKEEFAYWVHELRGRLGITVLLVEHDMKMVMGVSDRVVCLNHGRIIAEGPPAAIQANPEVIRAYLGAKYAGRP